MRHLFCVENIDRCGSNWPLETKMCNFDPKFGYLGPKVNSLVWNRNNNGPGSSRNYRETAVFKFGQKVFFWPKLVSFFSKKHPKFAKRLIFIWEKGPFLYEQLCPVVARTWCPARSESFFWARNSDFGPVSALALSARGLNYSVHGLP